MNESTMKGSEYLFGIIPRGVNITTFYGEVKTLDEMEQLLRVNEHMGRLLGDFLVARCYHGSVHEKTGDDFEPPPCPLPLPWQMHDASNDPHFPHVVKTPWASTTSLPTLFKHSCAQIGESVCEAIGTRELHVDAGDGRTLVYVHRL